MRVNSLLIVEDEPLIRDLLESVFTEEGFQVVIASDGTQAMTTLHAGAAQFGAMITDVRLGAGPDGWDVARLARELAPNMPIVYVSGNSAYDWQSKGVPNSVYISKPFALARIITAVARLLDKADPDPSQHTSNPIESGCLMTGAEGGG
jgi:DNA-binding response OmpR family regulator